MAFRLPSQAPRRQRSYSATLPPALDPASSLSQPPGYESTEWVLFSPTQPSTTARTHTTSTERTQRTAGVSRLSDFGSFGTPTRSAWDQDNDDVEEEEENDALEEPLDEDGTELDSLDDGLHAFRAPSLNIDQESAARLDQGAPAHLPAHDGLGSFQASSQVVQEQLWQYEQYNPSRRHELTPRRRSSVQRHLDSIANEEQIDVERERWQRIEKWRMDQSRALLQEIERETRRRRNSRVSYMSDQAVPQSEAPGVQEGVPETPKECISPSVELDDREDESLWRRITRKVIRDLIGIDDSLLSVLFGESLPIENEEKPTSAGTDPATSMDETLKRELDSVPDDHGLWQSKLLQRIAHELGVLVHQLCEHPGAFTTYLTLSQEIPGQYAGMPLGRLLEEGSAQPQSASADLPASTVSTNDRDSVLSPQFSPTLREPSGREHAAQWGIEEDGPSRLASNSGADPLSESARIQQEKEYWERELDVMMVFRYLRSRFSRRNSNADMHHAVPRRPSQDASLRAAIIRQHHPLVARAHSRSQAQIRRQSQYSTSYSGAVGVSSPLLRQQFRRPSSSCASQSAKLSAISSRRTLTGSSRNYWDIGGSVDSGSAIAPVGAGMGSWGDV
ncbi:hypothetical protein EYZ11_000836 [Aspergillus tanneri]|uniref:Uncharacterized protein n=1 Tax=Aspergillus tanneri TaxID=1220188 RepID=A0A4S3JW56_9EURO|nr:uncharacterized protein ATNIH1004_003142 [Aspergillus tanneri]KAA8650456.1 hypothetical protein ATNIH1004_003142 [Aspergillus tanneri]THC99675.1 hypothetical protein EYZ11_000836 [Aspergillus tanneri]